MKSNQNRYTGYTGIYKGIVTRPYTDDPLNLGRFQVWMPFYHGGDKPDQSYIGSTGSAGKYPWAQVSSIRFESNGTNQSSSGNNIWSTIFGSLLGYSGGSTYGGDVKQADLVYPNVGDPVWIQFENGDIRYPVYVGSLVNGNETITANAVSDFDIAKKTVEMIVGNESRGKYNLVNWKDGGIDDGGISVGIIQWHNARAREVFLEIKSISTDGYNKVCADNNCSDFDSILNNENRWKPARFDQNSVQGKTIQALLDTDDSRTAQDNLALKDVQKYIDKARNKGYNDVGAIMLIADYINKSGHLPDIKINPSTATLDQTLNAILNISNIPRWNNDYNYILGLVKSGELTRDNNGNITTSYVPGESNELLFTFPVPSCQNITRKFSSGTCGVSSIDISNGKVGLEVVAAHDGTAEFGYDSERGNYVKIEYKQPTLTSSKVANIALREWTSANVPTKKSWNYAKNSTPYSNGSKGAWCAYFSTWCCVQAGVMKKQNGSVRSVESYFKSLGKFGTYPNYKPVIGDLLTMRFDNGKSNHIGVVVSVSGDTITVVDGNTRSGMSPRPPKGTSSIAKTTFSYSKGKSTGGGFYTTVGYCKTGLISATAASQYESTITEYYHLATKIGDNGKKIEVKAGQKIGTIGQTGKCSGALLEFSMKLNGTYVDPLSKMSATNITYNKINGDLIGSYAINVEYPSANSVDMKGAKISPNRDTLISVPNYILNSYGLKYGSYIIIEGIERSIQNSNSKCKIINNNSRTGSITVYVSNKSIVDSWKNPNYNVYIPGDRN